MAVEFAQPQSGPGAEQAAFGYGALQTTLATQPNQKDMFGAQVQANRDQLQANLGVNKDVFGAAVNSAMADKAAANQAQRDQFQAEQQAQRQDQQFQQQSQLADQHANLQAQLSEAQLSQGETLRMQRLTEAMDYVDNDPSLGPIGEDTEDRSAAKLQIRTGLNPLQMRQQRAQALASELQLQQVQQQQGLADAMGIEGDTARAQAFLRRSTFVDPATGTRYGLDAHGNIAGTFDEESGEYVPFTVQSRRDQQAAQQQARDDAAEEKARMAEEKRQQKAEDDARREEANRQNQLAAATQRTDQAVRNELTNYRRQSAQTAGAAEPPLWIKAELEARTPPGGTAPAFSILSADEINELVAQETDSRVRNTHGHLIGIDPSSWTRAAGSEGNPFTGEQSTAAPAAAAAGRSAPASPEAPYVPPEVGLRPSSIDASRVSTLANAAKEAWNGLSLIQRAQMYGTLGSLARLYDKAASENRPLTIAERAWAETYVRNLRQSGNGTLAARVDPNRQGR